MNKGMVYAVGAYVIWGLLPIFWKALAGVPALEILAHRVAWSLFVVLGLVAVWGNWTTIGTALRNRRVLGAFTLTAVLLSTNWFLYIWAVNAGYIIETSLGYFINPLVNVLLGVIFLRERPRMGQGLAILVALSGVLYLTFSYGRLPWIALVLAFSFAIYGLLRKTAALNSLEGLTLETVVLVGPAVGYLLYLQVMGQAALGSQGLGTSVLLVAAGVATATPLLLFAAAARRLTLTTLGILQYIAPTLQFALGVFVYGETLSSAQLLGYCIVWAALIIYTGESLWHSNRTARLRALEA